jgi:hypothetical protein
MSLWSSITFPALQFSFLPIGLKMKCRCPTITGFLRVLINFRVCLLTSFYETKGDRTCKYLWFPWNLAVAPQNKAIFQVASDELLLSWNMHSHRDMVCNPWKVTRWLWVPFLLPCTITFNNFTDRIFLSV